MFTGSLFKSQYRPSNNKWYSTPYDRNHTMTLLGGKEFKIGKAKQNVFALNGKAPDYYRVDLGMSFRFNRENTSHSFSLDVQNVSNRPNTFSEYYNSETENIESGSQTGIFPNFNYRVEF
ncbi:MAG: hypothetical protein ACI959_000858 [Limisphaerales bacterium]|jgi:hypothetical protein